MATTSPLGVEEAIDRSSSGSTSKHTQCNLSLSVLEHVLQGVAVATKAAEHYGKATAAWFASCDGADDSSTTPPESRSDNNLSHSAIHYLEERFDAVERISDAFEVRQLASLTVAVAFLRESSRRSLAISTSNLDLVWRLIYTALTLPQENGLISNASRSAQGFLAVPLCSLVKDGNIDELFRLHVWMPDGQRGHKDFAFHAHQPFAQSWILAGKGTDRAFDVQAVTDSSSATHAEYALSWSDGSAQSTTYKTHQTSSTIVNTHKFVCAKPAKSAIHTRDASYTVPAATFHTTEVEPNTIHATLFFFDSHRGFYKDARILGPIGAESLTQIRDPNGLTAARLAETANVLRSYEQHVRRGQRHAECAELEHTMKEYNIALNIIESSNESASLAYYRQLILGELGIANRRLGRYEIARDYLEQALADMEPCHAHIDLSGELCVVYRHMSLFEEAKSASEVQYKSAAQLGFVPGMSRAIGTLGMVNYQLSQQRNDTDLLRLAIEQLTERVRSARSITAWPEHQIIDRKTQLFGKKRELIGLSRLSLCYTALGDLAEAQAKAWESLCLAHELDDPTDVAMSRFFYGRVLLKNGQQEKALEQFSPYEGRSPAIFLCQEPSDEHRGYLKELIAAGVDVNLVDEQGYTALDYAVFSDDKASQEIIMNRLRQVFQGDVEQQLAQRQKQASIRKAYRELFQESLRPILLKGGDKVFQTLRHVYAKALSTDERKRSLYDGFKFIWYSEFLRSGKLPRSSDGLTNEYVAEVSQNSHSVMPDFVIFFSYRWINDIPKVSSPDDSQNTQYRRMIAALEEFLKMHPAVDREKLGIWIVRQSYCSRGTPRAQPR